MEKAYIKTYKIVHNDRPDRNYYDTDYTKDLETQFRPLQLIEDYNPQYIDREYGKDPFWDDELYDTSDMTSIQQTTRTTLILKTTYYPRPS